MTTTQEISTEDIAIQSSGGASLSNQQLHAFLVEYMEFPTEQEKLVIAFIQDDEAKRKSAACNGNREGVPLFADFSDRLWVDGNRFWLNLKHPNFMGRPETEKELLFYLECFIRLKKWRSVEFRKFFHAYASSYIFDGDICIERSQYYFDEGGSPLAVGHLKAFTEAVERFGVRCESRSKELDASLMGVSRASELAIQLLPDYVKVPEATLQAAKLVNNTYVEWLKQSMLFCSQDVHQFSDSADDTRTMGYEITHVDKSAENQKRASNANYSDDDAESNSGSQERSYEPRSSNSRYDDDAIPAPFYPLANFDGTPMIQGTWVDVSGNSFGSDSF